MKPKLLKIAKRINPYGGINFVIHALRKERIPELLDKHLGQRVKQARYKYSDILLSWACATLCGAKRLEDINQLRAYFNDIPSSKCPSPDRIGYIFKKLATENILIKPGNKNNQRKFLYPDHVFNINTGLNDLLIATALRLNLLNKHLHYTLDYDNVVIETEKHDSRTTFKHCNGYAPGVSFIGKVPVYIEGRGGNSGASNFLNETLARTFDRLDAQGVKVGKFRSDAAAYSKKTVDLLDSRGIEFYIRAKNSDGLTNAAFHKGDWERVAINEIPCEVTSIQYKPFKGSRAYRMVLQRLPKEKGKGNEQVSDTYNCRAIITNNYSLPAEKVIDFYNQRGDIENNFASLLNDFNWKRLPFSFLNENTVFMILSAITAILYRYILIAFSRKVNFVSPNYELKTFIFRFIAVALEWVQEEMERVPIIYSEKNYEVLLE